MTPATGRWPRPDVRLARALVAAHLPGEDAGNVAPLGEGDFCVAFAVGRRVVRVAKHPEAAAALRREARVLARIASRLPLPVPRPSFFDPPAGPPFSVHDLIAGEPLSREGWLALPAPAREATAAQLGG